LALTLLKKNVPKRLKWYENVNPFGISEKPSNVSD
jgi:hypothetical protein